MAKLLKPVLMLSVLLLAGCSSLNPMNWFTAHRMDIQQGNYVTEDAVARVKPGMNRSQVRFLLGTPLLNDIFHANRWDYLYRIERPGKPSEEKSLVVYFNANDQVERVDGQAFPALRPQLEASNPIGQVKQ